MTHPAPGLDEVVHQRFRLGILAIAGEAERVDFSYLRTALEFTAGNLSRHLDVLAGAGLIAMRRDTRANGPAPGSAPPGREKPPSPANWRLRALVAFADPPTAPTRLPEQVLQHRQAPSSGQQNVRRTVASHGRRLSTAIWTTQPACSSLAPLWAPTDPGTSHNADVFEPRIRDTGVLGRSATQSPRTCELASALRGLRSRSACRRLLLSLLSRW